MTGIVEGIVSTARAALQRWRGANAVPVLPADEAYARWAPTYGTPNTPLQALEAEARADVLPDLRGATILDVGCGTGRVAREALAVGAARTIGMDPSRPMLARARREAEGARAAWLVADARRLPFRDDSLDGVVCALVLGHVAEPAPALAEMARVVRPGGWAVLSDFHPDATRRGWERTFVDADTGRGFRVEHHAHPIDVMGNLLEEAGLAVEAWAERRYEGTPVVFAARARRAEGGEP